MSRVQDHFRRIETIVGDTKHDGQISLNFHWDDYHSAKAVLGEIRRMQKEIRLVKKQVAAEQSATRSEFISSKASVGHGIGSAIGGAIFGRKAIGKINAARRDDVRRSQRRAMQPYEALKQVIDTLLAKLDQFKTQIELSTEYQNRPPQATTSSNLAASPSPLASTRERNFFLFLGEEVKGPFTLHQISGLLAAHAADAATLACPVGSEEWVALYELPEFEQIQR